MQQALARARRSWRQGWGLGPHRPCTEAAAGFLVQAGVGATQLPRLSSCRSPVSSPCPPQLSDSTSDTQGSSSRLTRPRRGGGLCLGARRLGVTRAADACAVAVSRPLGVLRNTGLVGCKGTPTGPEGGPMQAVHSRAGQAKQAGKRKRGRGQAVQHTTPNSSPRKHTTHTACSRLRRSLLAGARCRRAGSSGPRLPFTPRHATRVGRAAEGLLAGHTLRQGRAPRPHTHMPTQHSPPALAAANPHCPTCRHAPTLQPHTPTALYLAGGEEGAGGDTRAKGTHHARTDSTALRSLSTAGWRAGRLLLSRCWLG